MGFKEDFERGRAEARAARGAAMPLSVKRPQPKESERLEVARPVPAEPALDERRVAELEREIARLERQCRAQGDRYPGCPLDMIAAETALMAAVSGTFVVGRWLLGLSPQQRERRRAALMRAGERAAKRQKQWQLEAAAREQPRVRVTRVAKLSPSPSSAIKRSAHKP